MALGLFKDDISRLVIATDYLRTGGFIKEQSQWP